MSLKIVLLAGWKSSVVCAAIAAVHLHKQGCVILRCEAMSKDGMVYYKLMCAVALVIHC